MDIKSFCDAAAPHFFSYHNKQNSFKRSANSVFWSYCHFLFFSAWTYSVFPRLLMWRKSHGEMAIKSHWNIEIICLYSFHYCETACCNSDSIEMQAYLWEYWDDLCKVCALEDCNKKLSIFSEGRISDSVLNVKGMWGLVSNWIWHFFISYITF